MSKQKASKHNHLRRKFIGARIEFDGYEEHGQCAQFANGRLFNEVDINRILRFDFAWNIKCSMIYKNDLGFLRIVDEQFKTSRIRFNDLSPYVDELATKAGLGMPEGYKFHLNTWQAKVIG